MSSPATDGMQDALLAAARRARHAAYAGLGIGGVALAGLSLAGQFVAGALFCVGLLLGAVNNRMVQRSLAAWVQQDEAGKGRLMLSILRRLVVVTAVALGIAYVYRPEGWTVLLGLAVFQLLLMGSVFGGLYKEVRRA